MLASAAAVDYFQWPTARLGVFIMLSPNGNRWPCQLRLIGVLVAVGVLTLAIVVCHLFTGKAPETLETALLFLIGYLCREVTTWDARHLFPAGRNAPPKHPEVPT
jgi:hypothetical protein